MRAAKTWSHSGIAGGVALAAILTLVVTLSAGAGLLSAFLAADDFQWLGGGRDLLRTWRLPAPSGDAFYRPTVMVWFGAVVSVCGWSTACYHAGSLALHLVNVSLVMWLTIRLTGDWRTGALTTVLFALQPADAQAIAWISAATELLAATFFLASLCLQVASWRTSSRAIRRACEVGAVVSFAGAFFSHEAAITLPLASWVMWRTRGPFPLERRKALTAAFAMTTIAFGIVTILANRENALFEESGYRIGPHMFRHALDYAVGFYVGPASWGAYAACLAVSGVLLWLSATTRLGILWMWLLMLPFLGFTAGNASRYSYLPAVGFSLAIAAAVVVGLDAIARTRQARLAPVVLLLAGLFVAVRFGNFFAASMKSQVAWMEEWRARSTYLHENARIEPDDAVRLPAGASSDEFPAMYDLPILRWIHRNDRLETARQ